MVIVMVTHKKQRDVQENSCRLKIKDEVRQFFILWEESHILI